jgi:hypothetical protein
VAEPHFGWPQVSRVPSRATSSCRTNVHTRASRSTRLCAARGPAEDFVKPPSKRPRPTEAAATAGSILEHGMSPGTWRDACVHSLRKRHAPSLLTAHSAATSAPFAPAKANRGANAPCAEPLSRAGANGND